MSKYRLTSGKEVLARLIRANGGKIPSMYHDDILEWISEGLGMMQVTNSLVIESTADEGCTGELNVCNHCIELPCGFVSIIAVEDCHGNRLPEGGDVTDLRSTTNNRGVNVNLRNARVSSFEVNPFTHQTSSGLPSDTPSSYPPYYVDGSDIEPVDTTSFTHNYYKVVGNFIQTSFETGFIKIHYYAIPVGTDGYPLIPDNENFKQGLEWHVTKRLIGAGYLHPVFTYDYAHNQCELYMGRGIGEVSFYSPEGAAKVNRSLVRLIPMYNFYEDFFVNSEAPERLIK